MNSIRIPVFALGSVVGLSLLVGCNDSTVSGSPSPISAVNSAAATSESSASSSDSPGSGAPKVQHPLDASAFTNKPCTALTASDLSALGFGGAQGTDNTISLGAGCAWGVDERTVGIKWLQGNEHGLSDIYAQKSTMAYWRVLTVSGYPAVEADEIPNPGRCVVHVGVNDQLVFFASMDGADTTDQACSTAEQAAAAVIANLKAAQGGG